jgi:hypothetical protein
MDDLIRHPSEHGMKKWKEDTEQQEAFLDTCSCYSKMAMLAKPEKV